MMVKLIMSDAFDTSVDVGMRVVEDPAQITKQASTIFNCDYSDLKPDADHVGIHVVALGAGERYGSNRNADIMYKAACQKYHYTFVKHGHVYRHHRNKDSKKALGAIKASAYNDEMDRVELFIHANKEKCGDELQRLEKEGEIPFSMAVRVPGDFCSICNQFRKTASDPNECEHIRNHLGETWDDGRKVAMDNRDLTFFDISFVGRPADRIAWNLKVASADERIDSIKLAEQAGIWLPDSLAIESASALSKLALMRKLAEFETAYQRLAQQGPRTLQERYLWELRKSASSPMDESTLHSLRMCEPADVFHAFARAGVVMDAPTFYKYAFGPALGEACEHVPQAVALTHMIFSKLAADGECQTICNDAMFDVNTAEQRTGVPMAIVKQAASSAGFLDAEIESRVLETTAMNRVVKIAVDKASENCSNDTHKAMVLATKYAAYQLSAAQAIIEMHRDTDVDTVLAGLAAQNLMEK